MHREIGVMAGLAREDPTRAAQEHGGGDGSRFDSSVQRHAQSPSQRRRPLASAITTWRASHERASGREARYLARLYATTETHHMPAAPQSTVAALAGVHEEL